MRIAKLLLLTCVGPLLCSCSFPHPLQDDVTGLPLSKIVRKIACEARDALDELLEKRGLAWLRTDYKDTNNELKALTKRVLKPLQDEIKELQKEKAQLDDERAVVTSEEDAAKAALALFIVKFGTNKELPNDIDKMQERVAEKKVQINKRIAVHTRAVQAHKKALSLAQARIDSATEAAEKHNEGLARYYGLQMAYSFRFKITETDIATAGAGWRLPLIFNGNPGTWTIGGSVGDIKERDSERNVKLVTSFEDLHGLDCDDAPPQAGRLREFVYPIRGEIGVKEVLAQYFELLDRAERDQKRDGGAGMGKTIFAKTDSYTDTIIFTTTLTGSLAPTITLNPTLREQFSGSLGITGTRKDLHSVVISLTTPSDDDKEDKIQKIQIVKDDGLGAR